jgi:hypothetical protein
LGRGTGYAPPPPPRHAHSHTQVEQPRDAETRVRSQASPCCTCGGKSGTVMGFFQTSSLSPCHYHHMNAPYFFIRLPSNAAYSKQVTSSLNNVQSTRTCILCRCFRKLEARAAPTDDIPKKEVTWREWIDKSRIIVLKELVLKLHFCVKFTFKFSEQVVLSPRSLSLKLHVVT